MLNPTGTLVRRESKMSFLLRFLFWLGLAFSQIADREGASLSKLAQPARQELTAGAEQLTQRAVSACRDHAAACLALAAQAAQVGAAPSAGTRTAPERAGGDQDQGAGARLGSDTLRATDRAPAWRLHHQNEGA
jgi:hypothetical protein